MSWTIVIIAIIIKASLPSNRLLLLLPSCSSAWNSTEKDIWLVFVYGICFRFDRVLARPLSVLLLLPPRLLLFVFFHFLLFSICFLLLHLLALDRRRRRPKTVNRLPLLAHYLRYPFLVPPPPPARKPSIRLPPLPPPFGIFFRALAREVKTTCVASSSSSFFPIFLGVVGRSSFASDALLPPLSSTTPLSSSSVISLDES